MVVEIGEIRTSVGTVVAYAWFDGHPVIRDDY